MIMRSSNLIVDLCQNDRFKNLEYVEEYEAGSRNIVHVMWCWVLVLFREFSQSMMKEPGFVNSALFFVKNFQGRIINVLRRPHFLRQNTEIGFASSISPGSQGGPTSAKFSMAVSFIF